MSTVDELPGMVGHRLGRSSWREITQEQVSLFAKATWDDQWIHVDPVRAAEGPYGGTIAHGFLTLSLIPALLDEVLQLDGAGLVINRGLKEVRFRAPVPVGANVSLLADVTSVKPRARDFTEVVVDLTIEVDHSGALSKAATAQLTLLVQGSGYRSNR